MVKDFFVSSVKRILSYLVQKQNRIVQQVAIDRLNSALVFFHRGVTNWVYVSVLVFLVCKMHVTACFSLAALVCF